MVVSLDEVWRSEAGVDEESRDFSGEEGEELLCMQADRWRKGGRFSLSS